jgi:hypothetical protein
VLGVRAERILVGAIPGMNQIIGVLERTTYAGDTVTHLIDIGDVIKTQVTEPGHGGVAREGVVTLSFPPAACMVFPP